VLNDSEQILSLFEDLLTDADYRVVTGMKLYESVDDLLDVNPDLLLLDFLWSGDHSGWAFLHAVRRDSRTARLPVVVCTTGREQVAAIEDQLAELNIVVVYKPFEIDDLLDVIGQQLASSMI
jgi:DNA-binding response OmpR family regulator